MILKPDAILYCYPLLAFIYQISHGSFLIVDQIIHSLSSYPAFDLRYHHFSWIQHRWVVRCPYWYDSLLNYVLHGDCPRMSCQWVHVDDEWFITIRFLYSLKKADELKASNAFFMDSIGNKALCWTNGDNASSWRYTCRFLLHSNVLGLNLILSFHQ